MLVETTNGLFNQEPILFSETNHLHKHSSMENRMLQKKRSFTCSFPSGSVSKNSCCAPKRKPLTMSMHISRRTTTNIRKNIANNHQ
ncbi:hypothetical protein OWV82_006513 [Melia azedarach]|uniref:Uncharacterized protein n=1 Tax=Melia azedarach TaxID=155640 RepID=A0ACC1YJ21_MELAZ|nr:hypothetical protein OWV82_006513 [Melia azedarach]